MKKTSLEKFKIYYETIPSDQERKKSKWWRIKR